MVTSFEPVEHIQKNKPDQQLRADLLLMVHTLKPYVKVKHLYRTPHAAGLIRSVLTCAAYKHTLSFIPHDSLVFFLNLTFKLFNLLPTCSHFQVVKH